MFLPMAETQVPLIDAVRDLRDLERLHAANNYNPLDVVIERAEGVWMYDASGCKYLDCLSAYSAVNQGHCHPRIVAALREQAGKVTLTSRAFRNDKLPLLCRELADLCGMDAVLPMNTGAEAVETAIKAARRWGYSRKRIPEGAAQIIVCAENFHGRTTTIVGFSSEESYREGFGPFTPGFVTIPFGDAEALERAINPNTCAFLFEPIQCEAGVRIPPEGFLRDAIALCRERHVLSIADEIQTGLGRTGRMFACEHEGVKPDMYVLGKALSGGVYPVSAIVASREVMDVFSPGSHGSTYGGNPLACAVALEALAVLRDERLIERSRELGGWLLDELRTIGGPAVRQIRGRGLLAGIELYGSARPYCERLMQAGLLCKETHDHVIRIAPPLIIRRDELVWAVARLKEALGG
jgi:ornithine--oxo-acid transaminase